MRGNSRDKRHGFVFFEGKIVRMHGRIPCLQDGLSYFTSNYSLVLFFGQQLDVGMTIFDNFQSFFVHWMKTEHVLLSSNQI